MNTSMAPDSRRLGRRLPFTALVVAMALWGPGGLAATRPVHAAGLSGEAHARSLVFKVKSGYKAPAPGESAALVSCMASTAAKIDSGRYRETTSRVSRDYLENAVTRFCSELEPILAARVPYAWMPPAEVGAAEVIKTSRETDPERWGSWGVGVYRQLGIFDDVMDIFGNQLSSVARSLGKKMVFKVDLTFSPDGDRAVLKSLTLLGWSDGANLSDRVTLSIHLTSPEGHSVLEPGVAADLATRLADRLRSHIENDRLIVPAEMHYGVGVRGGATADGRTQMGAHLEFFSRVFDYETRKAPGGLARIGVERGATGGKLFGAASPTQASYTFDRAFLSGGKGWDIGTPRLQLLPAVFASFGSGTFATPAANLGTAKSFSLGLSVTLRLDITSWLALSLGANGEYLVPIKASGSSLPVHAGFVHVPITGGLSILTP